MPRTDKAEAAWEGGKKERKGLVCLARELVGDQNESPVTQPMIPFDDVSSATRWHELVDGQLRHDSAAYDDRQTEILHGTRGFVVFPCLGLPATIDKINLILQLLVFSRFAALRSMISTNSFARCKVGPYELQPALPLGMIAYTCRQYTWYMYCTWISMRAAARITMAHDVTCTFWSGRLRRAGWKFPVPTCHVPVSIALTIGELKILLRAGNSSL